MDKKDIYEHLAKIYLDASSKKKKKGKFYPNLFRNLFFVSIACVFVLSGLLFFSYLKNKPLKSEIALLLQNDAAKINFNFNPAKKESFTVSLNNLNLSRFKALGFSLKKANFRDKISLRVEFCNAHNETSEVYLRDIPHKWQDYKINLSEFRHISDWSAMHSLSFVVEEWNTVEDKGIVYIDNARFLR
jgi:hypothetical protein